MKNKWLLSTLLWVSGISLYAQSDFIPKIIPQSPNAASLGKYGDVPITLNTGQINPNIPIYEIKFNDFTFPIALSYSSSGLKTNETPSWVGMGWTLSATGVINRQLRGIPDETTHGFNGELPTASIVKSIANGGYTPVGATYTGLTKDEFKKRMANDYQYDSEPDLFVLSCAGLSGKFFFDETQTGSHLKAPVWIPDQRLKLEADFNYSTSGYEFIYNASNLKGSIAKFTVKDTKGVIYIFSKLESSVDDDEVSYGRRLTNAWYLKEINTPNGHRLDFTYKDRQMQMPPTVSQQKYVMVATVADLTPHSPGPQTPEQMTINETVLEKITIDEGNGGEILFVEETSFRSDWGFGFQKSKALSEIIIKNQAGTTVRSFKFTYAADVNRLLLRSVQEKNGTEEIPAHQFEYVQEGDIPPLPGMTTNSAYLYKEDHWGYYNSNSTELLTPTLNVSSSPNLGSGLFVDPSNRAPDATKSVIGQLKKITYPTKGTTEFEWEGHTYSTDANRPSRYTACSGTMETVASVNLTGSGSDYQVFLTDDFTIANGTQCTEFVQYMRFKNNIEAIVAEILIFNSDGYLFYQNTWERKRPTTLPDDGEIKNQTDVLWLPPGNYTLKVRLECEVGFNASGLIAIANAEFRQIVPPTGTSMINLNAGGVRIKKVTDCPSSSGCIVKAYSYNQLAVPTLSSGVLVNNPIYDYAMNISLPINSGAITGCADAIPHIVFTSSSQLPIATTLGSHLSYKDVKVTETNASNPSLTNGYTTYLYSTSNQYPDEGSEEFPFAPKTSYEWRRGNLESARAFNASPNLVKETMNFYSLPSGSPLSYNQLIGIKIGINKLIDCSISGEKKGYRFAEYRIVSGFNYVATTLESMILSGGGGSVTTQTDYEYNNLTHLQPTATETTDSQEKTIRMEMKYPDDLLSDATLGSSATALKGKNMVSIPLQQITKVATQTTKTQKTFYENSLVPTVSKVEVYEGSSTNPQTVSFTDYDNRGNLLSFNQNLVGPYTTYLWGYHKQLPIAEIKNATKSQVTSALALISIGGIAMDFDKVSDLTSESDILSLISQLRTQLPGAMITGLVHTHLIGVTKSINTAGQTTKFEYDGLGRLKKTYVQNGPNATADMQPIADYQYLYKN